MTKITDASQLAGMANDLCNAIDDAMMVCSNAMAGYPCHNAFKHMGELQQAFAHASNARQALNEFRKIDNNLIIVEAFKANQ